jgi:hypothetical protein
LFGLSLSLLEYKPGTGNKVSFATPFSSFLYPVVENLLYPMCTAFPRIEEAAAGDFCRRLFSDVSRVIFVIIQSEGKRILDNSPINHIHITSPSKIC